MSTFDFDSAAVGAAASTIRTAASCVSLAEPADAGGCGSAAVRGAIEDLRFWGVMSSQGVLSALERRAGDAKGAVAAYALLDDETAAAAGGTP